MDRNRKRRLVVAACCSIRSITPRPRSTHRGCSRCCSPTSRGFRGVSAAEWGDLEPYFEDAVVFVEWPEAGEGVLPAPRVQVRLEHGGEELRLVTIHGDVDPGLRHGN